METPHLNPRRKKERTVKTENHSQKNHAIADTIFYEKTPLLQKIYKMSPCRLFMEDYDVFEFRMQIN